MRDIKMIYREVISKRLKRKKEQLIELEKKMDGVESHPTTVDKRKFIEVKAKIEELETVLDIADSLFEMEEGKDGNIQQKGS